jgi:L-lactate dehydrogenase (cytochrome)
MADRTLLRCLNIEDVRKLALRRLPRPIFDMLDSGREDSVTMERNLADLRALEVIPRVLRDVAVVEPGARVLGCNLSFPLILSPTGAQTYLDPEGEVAAARAAAKARIMYGLSSFGSETIEAVGDAGPGPRLFQLNALVDDGLNKELMQRAKQAKFEVFCLTVDNPVSSRLESYERWEISLTKRPPLRTVIEFAKKPRWLLKQRNLKARIVPYVIRELNRRGQTIGENPAALSKTAFRRDLTWESAARLRKSWDGPFLLKGILSVEDAKLAVNMGATGLVVCNHGGLALDGAPSSISQLREIADTVGDKIEIFLGGGIRRGTSILKSLALGARAAMSGRAFLYGLAAGGEAGVTHVIELLRAEFVTALAASGCTRPNQLSREFIRH